MNESTGSGGRALFDFHGVLVGIESEDAGMLDALRRDFSWFLSSKENRATISWTLSLRLPSAGPARGRSFRDYRAWDEGPVRRVLYDDGARASFDFVAGRGEVSACEPVRLQELGHLAVLATVGEKLDAAGLHRVHALGFVRDGGAGLLLLPSGGGKSELALRLLSETGFGLLSDDTPLIGRDLLVRPFPTRLSFRSSADLSALPPEEVRTFRRRLYGERRLVDVERFRSRVGAAAPLRCLLVGRPAEGRPGAIGPVSPAATALSLAAGLVVGVGVPQMAEWRLRPNATCAVGLIGAGVSRAATAAAAFSRARRAEFRLDRDPARSAALLREWLDGGAATVRKS